MNTNLQILLGTHIAALVIGFAAAFWLISGGDTQNNKQDASYDQKLDNINNSVVELKNVMMSSQNKLNGLINFNRVIVKDNPRLKLPDTDTLQDEAPTEQKGVNHGND